MATTFDKNPILPEPCTCTGDHWSIVLLFPISPSAPNPHAHTVPSCFRASEKFSRATTDIIPFRAPTLPGPCTTVGMSLCKVSPTPNWPLLLPPQERTSLSTGQRATE